MGQRSHGSEDASGPATRKDQTSGYSDYNIYKKKQTKQRNVLYSVVVLSVACSGTPVDHGDVAGGGEGGIWTVGELDLPGVRRTDAGHRVDTWRGTVAVSRVEDN